MSPWHSVSAQTELCSTLPGWGAKLWGPGIRIGNDLLMPARIFVLGRAFRLGVRGGCPEPPFVRKVTETPLLKR